MGIKVEHRGEKVVIVQDDGKILVSLESEEAVELALSMLDVCGHIHADT